MVRETLKPLEKSRNELVQMNSVVRETLEMSGNFIIIPGSLSEDENNHCMHGVMPLGRVPFTSCYAKVNPKSNIKLCQLFSLPGHHKAKDFKLNKLAV